MKFQNNIIRYHLRNVLFLSGNACGGKTTLSRMLAKKHGLALYDMDGMYHQHRAIADEVHQPDTCYHMTNFHEQWTRPAAEQARWNMSSIREQSEMVLLDLMELSQNQTVVADVLYSPAYTPDILDYHQIVFLTVDHREIRNCYFNRPEKRSFYEFVSGQDLAETYFEHIFQGLELTNQLEREQMRRSGFLMLERMPGQAPEERLAQIERHFHLI